MKMVRRDIVGMMLIILVGAGCCYWVSVYTADYVVYYKKTKEYPIYHCTAPFGTIWIKQTAKGRFLLIVGTYRSKTDLVESYNVKAFDGDELITKIFDSTKVSVIVDGGFYLEEIWSKQVLYYSRNDEEIRSSNSRSKWVIHIPQLPCLNQTISMEWTFVE